MSVTDDNGGQGARGRIQGLDASDAGRSTLQRVFEKLTHMSEHLLEIENWFDARARDQRVAPRRKLRGLADVDRVMREEDGAA